MILSTASTIASNGAINHSVAAGSVPRVIFSRAGANTRCSKMLQRRRPQVVRAESLDDFHRSVQVGRGFFGTSDTLFHGGRGIANLV